MQTMGYDPEVAQTRSHVKNLTCSTRRLGAPAGPDSAFRGNLSLQKTGQGFYHIRRGEAILAPGCGTMVSRRPMDPGGTRRQPPAAAGPVPKGKPGAPPVHRRCRLWPCRDCRCDFHTPGFRRSPPSGDPSGAPPPPSSGPGPLRRPSGPAPQRLPGGGTLHRGA